MVKQLWARAQQTLRLMIGIPDYPAYLAHMRAHHPERTPMSYAAFFQERLNARYGRGHSKCC